MKTILTSIACIVGVLVSTGFSHANGVRLSQTYSSKIVENIASGNCSAKAISFASTYGNAQILSVEETNSGCVVVIRVSDNSGNPPRIIRRIISN